MKPVLAIAIVLVATSAHAAWSWKDQAKAAVETATLDQGFRTIPTQ
jgi:hypothetical protein